MISLVIDHNKSHPIFSELALKQKKSNFVQSAQLKVR